MGTTPATSTTSPAEAPPRTTSCGTAKTWWSGTRQWLRARRAFRPRNTTRSPPALPRLRSASWGFHFGPAPAENLHLGARSPPTTSAAPKMARTSGVGRETLTEDQPGQSSGRARLDLPDDANGVLPSQVLARAVELGFLSAGDYRILPES